jgi:hypothetical protein
MNAAPIGMTTRKIIVMPCIVKIWLYRSAENSFCSGAASWARMSRASTPPTTKKNSAAAPYMMPIFLWSTVLTQARHPVFARGRAKTPKGESGRVAPEGRASASWVGSRVVATGYSSVSR